LPAGADDPSPPPWLKVENGVTQPQFDSLYSAVISASRLIAALIAYLQRTRITGARHKVQLET